MFRISQFIRELDHPTPAGPRRNPPGPVVIWNLIRRCNLTCEHCYSISADKDFPGELNTEEVFKVMDDLKAARVPVLILSGGEPLLQSLGTLSCFGRRQPFFRGEFYQTLKILQRGDVAEADLTGSLAGAFGQTQFMPSTFNRIAVDMDGDGRRDLVRSVPDALGSTANYLAKSGWRSGQPWGYEVILPAGFDTALAGRTNRRPLSQSLALGLRRVDGGSVDLPADARSAILLPTGVRGPAFLVSRNYDAIYSYNAAESYALAIALLADRLRGGGGLRTPWPTDDPGLSRAQRRELQTLLAARGHDIGAIDGAIGGRTRAAVIAEQQRLGMATDGRPGQKLLQALRAGR